MRRSFSGHGSTLNADSSRPTHVRWMPLESAIFAQVVMAFWKEHPMLAGALRQVFAPGSLWCRSSSARATSRKKSFGNWVSPGSKTVCRVLHWSRLRIHHGPTSGPIQHDLGDPFARVDDVPESLH